MTVHPTIRIARPADAADLVALLIDGLLEPGGEDPGDLRPYLEAVTEILTTTGTELLVAEHNGRVVGMCLLIMFRHLQSRGGRSAEIESVHVRLRDLRSQGVGGLLVEAAVDRASAAGCYRVQLTSNKARVDAHRFYARHGFVASHEGYKRRLTATP